MKRAILAIGLILGVALTANAVEYDKPVTLAGVLNSSTGESPDGKAVQFPSLRLSKPITVESSDPGETEKNVTLIQLVLKPDLMQKYKALKGKSAKVNCSLFHSDNGNHYTKVLCEVSAISSK